MISPKMAVIGLVTLAVTGASVTTTAASSTAAQTVPTAAESPRAVHLIVTNDKASKFVEDEEVAGTYKVGTIAFLPEDFHPSNWTSTRFAPGYGQRMVFPLASEKEREIHPDLTGLRVSPLFIQNRRDDSTPPSFDNTKWYFGNPLSVGSKADGTPVIRMQNYLGQTIEIDPDHPTAALEEPTGADPDVKIAVRLTLTRVDLAPGIARLQLTVKISDGINS